MDVPFYYNLFLKLVRTEVDVARENYPNIYSLHDGYAIILEELEEFWDECKKKPSMRDNDNLLKELIQVAAMCQRTAEDLKLMQMDKQIRVWCIGGELEFYAAYSEEEMRQFYTKLVGEEQAALDFADGFEEVPQSKMDTEFWFNDDGVKRMTTWSKELVGAVIPNQISTGYN